MAHKGHRAGGATVTVSMKRLLMFGKVSHNVSDSLPQRVALFVCGRALNWCIRKTVYSRKLEQNKCCLMIYKTWHAYSACHRDTLLRDHLSGFIKAGASKNDKAKKSVLMANLIENTLSPFSSTNLQTWQQCSNSVQINSKFRMTMLSARCSKRSGVVYLWTSSSIPPSLPPLPPPHVPG